jgi:dTDP-4-amino-4,6-dideoxygalactose transaminase
MGRVPEPWVGGRASWLRLPFLPADHARDRVDTREAIRLGIMPAYPIPLSRLPGFDKVREPQDYPGAEELALRLRTIPTHGGLSSSDLQRLERWLASS